MGGRLTEMERPKSGVQVVVSEAPPSGGLLRSILELDGFDVVGTASSPEELQHVLLWTDPHVVVFDAATSVTTVAAVRETVPEAGLVVVWPAGVTASLADVKVEPWRVEFDLGKAVRAARVRHAPLAARKVAGKIAPADENVEEATVAAAIADVIPIKPQGLEPRLVPAAVVAADIAAEADTEAATAASVATAPVADAVRTTDPVARRRAELALLFAAASFAVLLLMLFSQLAAQRVSRFGIAAPIIRVVLPGGFTTEPSDAGVLQENPVAPAGQTATLLTQIVSGGVGVNPAAPASGAGGTASGSPSHSPGGSGGGPGIVRAAFDPFNGGSINDPRNIGGRPDTSNGSNSHPSQGNGNQNGGGNQNGQSHHATSQGKANGQSGSSHGQSGQTHGQSGQSHGNSTSSQGQSGQSHGNSSSSQGQSGQTHGQSGQDHGQSGQSHGQSDQAHGPN